MTKIESARMHIARICAGLLDISMEDHVRTLESRDEAIIKATLEKAANVCDAQRRYHNGLRQSCEHDAEEQSDAYREGLLEDECEELRDKITSLTPADILKEDNNGKA